MAFWGVEIKPGNPFTLSPNKTTCGRLRISQATLGLGSFNNNNKSSSVQCNVGKKAPVLLCSLLPDKAESIHLELEFEEAEGVTFSVIGPRSVHLTGYFQGKPRHLLAGDDESESYGEDIGAEDTDISDELADSDDYGGSFIDDGEPTYFSSSSTSSEEDNRRTKKSSKLKGNLKRLKKKAESSEHEDDVVTSCKNTTRGRNREQVVDSDQDDEEPISSLRANIQMDSEALKRKADDVAGQAIGECKADGRKLKRKKRDDASVKTTDDCQTENSKVKKKKQKKQKNEAVENLEKPSDDFLAEHGGTKTNTVTRTTSDGLVIEELHLGEEDGKVATSGRKVTVQYTGTLKEGGKVFDTTIGKKPLKFRLGKDVAMDGLDRGVDGMRVGGRRRLLIPPKLGYGSEGTDRVPPNSWLVMDVELLRVR